jgi:hypothetical protein
MKTVVPVVFLDILLKAILLGMGIGVGFLIHWIIQPVDLGMAILIGLVATGLTVHFYGSLTHFIGDTLPEAIDPDPEIIPRVGTYGERWPAVPPIIMPPPPSPRRRRKPQAPPDR